VSRRVDVMDTAKRPMEHWKASRGATVERLVFMRQPRRYRAAQRGATTPVRRRQKLLWRARAAPLLAVRQVTQDNRSCAIPTEQSSSTGRH
jgi:hypothetical protein